MDRHNVFQNLPPQSLVYVVNIKCVNLSFPLGDLSYEIISIVSKLFKCLSGHFTFSRLFHIFVKEEWRSQPSLITLLSLSQYPMTFLRPSKSLVLSRFCHPSHPTCSQLPSHYRFQSPQWTTMLLPPRHQCNRALVLRLWTNLPLTSLWLWFRDTRLLFPSQCTYVLTWTTTNGEA